MADYKITDRRGQDRQPYAADGLRGISAPIKTNDRQRWYTGAAQVADAAKPSLQRRSHLGFDRDSQRTIQGADRRALLSISRWLYWNDSIIRGAINDIATIAAGHLAMQFSGADAAWGKQAETWLDDHDRFCSIRGNPYTMQVLSRLVVLHTLIDGDCFFLLTEGASGWPLLQFIPAHRVRGDFPKANNTIGPDGISVQSDAPWADLPVTDGVIVDDYGRPQAYRVYDDFATSYRDIDAANMVHVFDVQAGDQIRGVSTLAASIQDMGDLGETRRYELIAQKLGASIALVENNETGDTPTDASQIIGADDATDDGTLAPVLGKQMRGGEIQYFRAGTGSKLEALDFDRPSQNQREFAREVARNALHGIGWSIDYSLDPTRIGGAPARIVVEKLNRTLRNIRDHVLIPFRRRVDGWRVAKAEKAGFIPASAGSDWRSWTYKGSADLTADAMYSAQVMELELAKGITSEFAEAQKRGVDFETIVDQRVAAAVLIRDKCKAAGIDPTEVRLIASQSTQTFTDPAQDTGTTEKDPNAKP